MTVSKCLTAIRTMPLGTGFDIPWHWMQKHQLTNGSLVFPVFDFSEDHLKQTAARVVFALMLLTPFCKVAAMCNTGLGAVHLSWCICNIKTIDRSELEMAFIRVSTAVYDLVIVFLLSSYFIGSGYLNGTLLVALALSPQQALQFHHGIFEKAVLPPSEGQKPKIDHYHLKKGCLIQVLAEGWTFTILPPEAKAGILARLGSVPYGLWSFARGTHS